MALILLHIVYSYLLTTLQYVTLLDSAIIHWNDMATALKSTLANLQEKIIPELVETPQLCSLFPSATDQLLKRINAQLAKTPVITITTLPPLRN